MLILIVITVISLILSFIADFSKTIVSLKLALKMFLKILPAFFTMLMSVSIILYFVSPKVIQTYLGSSNIFFSSLLALAMGSITMLPGFIVFPLGGILLKQGVSYFILGMFTTSLMMVGVATFPVEKKFLGTRLAILRNLIGLIIAIIVSFVIGLLYGEFNL